MTGDEIIKELKEKGYTLTRVADELGIGNTTIGKVVKKGRSSRRVQYKICEILEKSFEDVWNKTPFEKNSDCMSPSEILHHLWINNETEISIKNELGISQPAVSQVINGWQRSMRIQTHICKIIGRKWEDVWTETRKRGKWNLKR